MAVLFVLTSHARTEGGVATGLREQDFAEPYYLLIDAGQEVVLASPEGSMPPIQRAREAPANTLPCVKRLNGDRDARDALSDTLELRQVFPEDFSGAFFAAGPGTLFDLAHDRSCHAIVTEFFDAGRPLAFVGESTSILLRASRPDGATLIGQLALTAPTASEQVAHRGHDPGVPTLESQFRRLARNYSCAQAWTPHTCTDNQLVTGQNWMSASAAAQRLLLLLAP